MKHFKVAATQVDAAGWTLTIDDRPPPILRANRMMRQTALVERVRAYDPDADEFEFSAIYQKHEELR